MTGILVNATKRGTMENYEALKALLDARDAHGNELVARMCILVTCVHSSFAFPSAKEKHEVYEHEFLTEGNEDFATPTSRFLEKRLQKYNEGEVCRVIFYNFPLTSDLRSDDWPHSCAVSLVRGMHGMKDGRILVFGKGDEIRAPDVVRSVFLLMERAGDKEGRVADFFKKELVTQPA